MAWVETVLADFDTFLRDHAACERKASATAMALISHYPDRDELVEAMVPMAQEEMLHFAQVYTLLKSRGQRLGGKDIKDPYVNALRALMRGGRDGYFMDRLILSGLIEARGCERFGLIAEHAPTERLRSFYDDIGRSESRHHGLFLRLARTYFPQDEVQARHQELLDSESEIMLAQPLRAAVH